MPTDTPDPESFKLTVEMLERSTRTSMENAERRMAEAARHLRRAGCRHPTVLALLDEGAREIRAKLHPATPKHQKMPHIETPENPGST